MGRKAPARSEIHSRGLKNYVAKWLRKNLTPLPADTVVLGPEYIESINQSYLRKVELLAVHNEREGLPLLAGSRFKSQTSRIDTIELHCFPKAESYIDWKYPRMIAARVDPAKICFGKYFKLIEGELYEGKVISSNHRYEFIKHVPVCDRPSYIEEKVGKISPDTKYAATDYTSFEAHFDPETMKLVEFQLYEYMTQYLDGHETFMQLLDLVLAGTNHMIFKEFEATLDGTRMSGETNTSLGNGFFNLMAFKYAAKVAGARNVKGVIEGDDGLFSFEGPAPDAALFEDMGMIIKLEYHPDLHSASFCGIIYDPDDKANLKDPLHVIVNTPFTTMFYAMAKDSTLDLLLKAKAYSLAYQYPRCPVISAYSEYLLRMTSNVSDSDLERLLESKGLDIWEKSVLAKAIGSAAAGQIGVNSRFLMESKFGVSVEDQLYLEKYFREKDNLKPIDDDHIVNLIKDRNPVWATYFQDYSMRLNRFDKNLQHPPLYLNNIRDQSEVPTRSEWGKTMAKVRANAKINLATRPLFDSAVPETDLVVLRQCFDF
jgi:hypothetical protein